MTRMRCVAVAGVLLALGCDGPTENHQSDTCGGSYVAGCAAVDVRLYGPDGLVVFPERRPFSLVPLRLTQYSGPPAIDDYFLAVTDSGWQRLFAIRRFGPPPAGVDSVTVLLTATWLDRPIPFSSGPLPVFALDSVVMRLELAPVGAKIPTTSVQVQLRHP